jgi:hypothetical protein
MAKPNNLFSTLPCFASQIPMHVEYHPHPPAKPTFQHHPKYNNKLESGIPNATSILLLLLPFFVHFSNDL